ncbi:MAG TPA: tetratricopeptide repeat protein [Acidobacteriaceae bacterium]|nr:tetratricopeptide repeat protein [Acidobacteriaceae bacterium]
MIVARLGLVAALAVITGSAFPYALAKDLRITIPRASHLTPVQRLNREGVEAVRKHEYEKAEAMFYRAYLYDASDPFTLNNLGYISELQGKLDRARKFYALASEQDCDAVIDLSNAKGLEGKPMIYALNDTKDVPMRVNSINVRAIDLLSQDRNFEAELLLRQALALEPQNIFTLNNLGVAEEATGDFEAALKYYDAAAALHSSEPIIVALKPSWRGKPISEVAAQSARQLRSRLRNINTAEVRARMFTMHGVSAVNRNDWSAAKQDFIHAYSLNPDNAFSLNNLGYVAEKDGDLETAQFYYSKAQKADNASARIGLTTLSSAAGKKLVAVASESDVKVDGELEQYRRAQRQQTGPIELIQRNSTSTLPSALPNQPLVPASPNAASPAPISH